MEGYLDQLEISTHRHGLTSLVRSHEKVWMRRYVHLNTAFHLLEIFVDDTMQERLGRIELKNAAVATAEEVGELLFKASKVPSSPVKVNESDKISVENSRRFVFRVEEAANMTRSTFHYFCAENGSDNMSSQSYREQWIATLRASCGLVPSPSTLDLRELNAKIAQYMHDLHISATVTNREEDEHGKGQYTVTLKAWILKNELVQDGTEENWQLLEYSCDWTIIKSSFMLQAFDEQLRLVFRDKLRDLILPSFSGMSTLLHVHTHAQKAVENQKRVERYDAYIQQLLCLPVFSVFGSDGSTMLDQFLEITQHLSSLKRLELSTGQSLHHGKKRVVPWTDRIQFEQLYHLHVEMMQAEFEKRKKVVKSSKHHTHHHEHHHHRSSSHSETITVDVEPLSTTIAPVVLSPPPAPVIEKDLNNMWTHSVHDRIAKLGQKLVAESFIPISPINTVNGQVRVAETTGE